MLAIYWLDYSYISILLSSSNAEADESGKYKGVQSQTFRICSSECRAPQNDKPYHLTTDVSSTKRILGKQAWSFHVAWLKEHKRLTFFVTQNLVFCFYCRLAATSGLLSFSKSASNAFVTKGFNNWKK